MKTQTAIILGLGAVTAVVLFVVLQRQQSAPPAAGTGSSGRTGGASFESVARDAAQEFIGEGVDWLTGTLFGSRSSSSTSRGGSADFSAFV